MSYSQNTGTQIYNASNTTSVYYTPAEYTAHYNSASDKNYENLLIAKGDGYWTVSGNTCSKERCKGTKYTVECESTGATAGNTFDLK